MARSLQERGEGLYMVMVEVKEPEKYARSLEAKGVQVDQVAAENGRTIGGRPKPPIPEGITHFVIGPRDTHGVLWAFGRLGTQTLTM